MNIFSIKWLRQVIKVANSISIRFSRRFAEKVFVIENFSGRIGTHAKKKKAYVMLLKAKFFYK